VQYDDGDVTQKDFNYYRRRGPSRITSTCSKLEQRTFSIPRDEYCRLSYNIPSHGSVLRPSTASWDHLTWNVYTHTSITAATAAAISCVQ